MLCRRLKYRVDLRLERQVLTTRLNQVGRYNRTASFPVNQALSRSKKPMFEAFIKNFSDRTINLSKSLEHSIDLKFRI